MAVDLSKIRLAYPVDMRRAKLTQGFGETRYFDYSVYGYPGHNGWDFGGLPEGEPMRAAELGVATPKTESGGFGNYVEIDHGGYSTVYAHLRGWAVKAGQLVEKGEVIGYLGNTGKSSGPHLHFGLKIPQQGTPGYKNWRDPGPFMEAIVGGVPPATAGGKVEVGDLAGVTSKWGAKMRTNAELLQDDSNLAGVARDGAKLGKVVKVKGDWAAFELWIHRSLLRKL